MRSPVLLSSLCLSIVLSAQPVLQYDNVGLPGSVYDLYVIEEPGDSDFDLEGPDADWDLTTSVVDLFGSAVFTLPDFTPYGEDYPEADLAAIITTYINGESTYSFYDLSAGGLNVLAEGIEGGSPKIYSDPSTIVQFPLSFGTAFTDDYVLNGTPVSLTRTYSGYGTMNIVLGTTANVVKVSASNGTMTWYRSDPVEPLLNISASNTRIYWERITIGMAEQRGLVQMTLAPNPASTYFRVPGLDASAAYRVLDPMGREVVTGRVAGAQQAVDVSALRPGVYRVLVSDALGARAATLMKD